MFSHSQKKAHHLSIWQSGHLFILVTHESSSVKPIFLYCDYLFLGFDNFFSFNL